MAKEIERKYLIRENKIDYATSSFFEIFPSIQALKETVFQKGKSIRQGFLPIQTGLKLSKKLNLKVSFTPTEVRLRDVAGKLFLTLKDNGKLKRNEAETRIDRKLFYDYWLMTIGKRVEKIRLHKPFGKYTLEIDVYTDRVLIVTEIEVPTVKEANILTLLGKDVTNDQRFKNRNLAK